MIAGGDVSQTKNALADDGGKMLMGEDDRFQTSKGGGNQYSSSLKKKSSFVG